MATYKKPTIQVSGTTLMGIEFSGDANAYEALKAHKTIKAKVDDKDALIPFHAVKEFAKSVVAEDAERTDPYCEEESAETITVSRSNDGSAVTVQYGFTPDNYVGSINPGESIEIDKGATLYMQSGLNVVWRVNGVEVATCEREVEYTFAESSTISIGDCQV